VRTQTEILGEGGSFFCVVCSAFQNSVFADHLHSEGSDVEAAEDKIGM
jgi:hypothetical protein